MAATATQTSQYIPGADRVRRTTLNGDNAYPTGGYDALAVLKAINTDRGFKRVTNVMHRSLASSFLGTPIVLAVYTNGLISSLKIAMRNPAGTAEVANGTDLSNLSLELITEGN